MRQKSLLMASVAAVLIGQLCCVAHAQQRPLFVPNELSIIYKSPKDADDAFAEMRSGSQVRGAPITGLEVTKTNSTTLTVHLQLPQDRGSSASDLDVLQDLADALQASDPRIESAGPVWIYYNPPGETGELGDIGAKVELQSYGKQPSGTPQGTRNFIANKDGPNPKAQAAPNDPLYFLQRDYPTAAARHERDRRMDYHAREARNCSCNY
jgi:hypothetical protein